MIEIRREARAPSHVQFGRRTTEVPLGVGISSIDEMKRELDHYWDVLLGRIDPPVESPYLMLMEVADAYFARAKEMHAKILELEREQVIPRGAPLQRFRTGYLRDFIEVAARASDKGSRRLSQEDLLTRQRRDAGEMR